MKQLTTPQQKLVEENHNLIYKYAVSHNLIIEEYYDLLAVGLCKAALSFNNDRGCAFSTVAYKCMENEVGMYWRHLRRDSAIPDDVIISYETPIESKNDSKNNTLMDVISDNSSIQNIVVGKIMSSALISLLSPLEVEIVNGIVSGLTHSEIAKELKCKRQNVSYHLGQIRQKWKLYLAN